MADIRQSILVMDHNFKVLRTHYDSKTSNLLRTLSDQINTFEKRWTQLISNLEQCSDRVNIFPFDFCVINLFFL
jgi:hypothetical protein